jgi:3-deoxy-D-arabino-heptulosonate 7-phosphate (DAHP) synthase
VYVLILTLFLAPGAAGVMTTVEFTSEKACNDAAPKWSMESMKTFGAASARFTAVCVAK